LICWVWLFFKKWSPGASRKPWIRN